MLARGIHAPPVGPAEELFRDRYGISFRIRKTKSDDRDNQSSDQGYGDGSAQYPR
jgi:hypothetical protein